MNEDRETEAIRSFMRTCNHWFGLMPDEEAVFSEAAYRGSQMDREHSVELLAALHKEDSPHHLAMIAQDAYRGIYSETNLRHSIQAIWEAQAAGHTFPKDVKALGYLPWEFRAVIDYQSSVDGETFDALCFGLYKDFEADHQSVEDCWAEKSIFEEHLEQLDFEGMKKELQDVEAAIKTVVGPSPERYYWNHCRSRSRFDRRLIALFEKRKEILNKMVLNTDDERQRFCAVDELLHDMTKKMYKRTANLYRSTIGNGDEAYDYNVEGWISYEIYFGDDEMLDNDDVYGSDFKYMMMCAYSQQELFIKEGKPVQIVSCGIRHEKEHTPEATDEELGMVDPFDGENWYATHYSKHPLCHHKICYAMHRLLENSLLSIPDVLRLDGFMVESQITSQYMRSMAAAESRGISDGYKLSCPDELMEYMRLWPKHTGLNMDIFVDDAGSYKRNSHQLLLFICNGYDSDFDGFIPMSVENKPRILDDEIEIKISYDDIFAVQDFVQWNLDKLIALADRKMSQTDFVDSIRTQKNP